MDTAQSNTLQNRQRQERVSVMLSCLLGVVLLYMSFLVTYHLLHDLEDMDLHTHLSIAKGMGGREALLLLLTGNERIWHTCVKILIRLGKIEDIYAACIVTAGSVVLTYGVACGLLRRALRQVDPVILPIAAFVLCLVGPLYVPWYNERIYVGQGSPNVWHSPTQLMVRPFALLAFWLTVRIYQRLRDGSGQSKAFQSWKEAAAYTILLAVTVVAKPCYFQGAVPALGILMVVDLIRSRGKALPFCLKVSAAHIPAALLTVMRFFSAFYLSQRSGGVEFAFLDVWRHNSESILMSILLLCAFPIFVMIMDRKRFFSRLEGQFALAMLVVNGLIKACLAEGGERRYHGNFGWGWMLSAMLLWFVTLKEYLYLMTGRELPEREYKIAAYVGWTLLALHFLTGIVYFCLIATGTRQC